GYGPGAFEGARPEGKLGLLELTAGGTLFLDGVGEMSPRLQAKLLRFLQDGCFRRVGSDEEVYLDVRVICATQVDLSELCAKGEFRQDLYHRLNVLSLHIPPLRECLDGLAPLAEHFLDQASRQIGCGLPKLSAQALERLERYHWPGNVRQLENVLFQAVSLCEGGTVKAEHIRLPDYGAPQPLGDFSLEGDLDAIVGRFEKAVLERLFREHPSSRQLGKRLGVSHTTAANKLRQHGVGQSEG
ncbi:sigma 54-interacting transcriptional regulator, partial [Pseudomonas aeruginosa]